MSNKEIVFVVITFVILISIQYTLNLILRELRFLRKDVASRLEFDYTGNTKGK